MRAVSIPRTALATITLIPFALLPACHKPSTHAKLVQMDGSLTDWPADLGQWADDRYLYLRLSPPALATLQANAEPLVLYLDADGDAATGIAPPHVDGPEAPPALGADLMIVFSPGTSFPQLTDRGTGVAAAVLFADGSTRHVSHADLDFSFTPTYAASDYEMRISRAGLECVLGVPVTDSAASRFVLLDAAGAPVGASDVARGLRSMGDEQPAALETIPACEQGAVRVVSWNVQLGAPNTTPRPFAHVLSALAPDIVLVQEWEDASAEQLVAWFDEHLAWGSPWHAMTSAGWGVAVVSRFPLERLGPERLDRPETAQPDGDRRDRDRATRFTGAVVQSPLGPIAAASIHLKCCGSMGSPEDLARIAEAGQIRQTFAAAADERAIALRIIAGDFNLVGSRTPLDELSSAGDADGTGLVPANPGVLGDSTFVTWTDARSNFSPGRLDWVLVGDSALAIQRSFVLDTARLGPAALRAAGLDERTSRASDHMPVVTDLVPAQ